MQEVERQEQARRELRAYMGDGFTLAELAREMGVSPSTLRRFLVDRLPPMPETSEKIRAWYLETPGPERDVMPMQAIVQLAAEMFPPKMQPRVRRFLLEQLAEAFGTERKECRWIGEELKR